MSGSEGGFYLDRKVAMKQLKKLADRYVEVVQRLTDIKSGKVTQSRPDEVENLEAQRKTLEEGMKDIREWYSATVLQSIEEQSRKLGWLTVGLIFLTAVLTVLTAVQVWRFLS